LTPDEDAPQWPMDMNQYGPQGLSRLVTCDERRRYLASLDQSSGRPHTLKQAYYVQVTVHTDSVT